jgi:hypothetical protein
MNEHPRARLVVTGAALGTVPGAATFVAGMIVGGETALNLGAIGILLAAVGAIIGASIGGAIHGGGAHRAAVTGGIIGVVPGLAMVPVQTRLGFPVMLVGVIAGALVGSRIGHGSSGARLR